MSVERDTYCVGGEGWFSAQADGHKCNDEVEVRLIHSGFYMFLKR